MINSGIYSDADVKNPSYYYVSRSQIVYDQDRKVLKVNIKEFVGSMKFVKSAPSLEEFLKFIEEHSFNN